MVLVGGSLLGYLFWFPDPGELALVTDISLICQAPARAVAAAEGRSFKAVPETDNSIWRADSSSGTGGLGAGGWGSTLPIKLINLLSPFHQLRTAF